MDPSSSWKHSSLFSHFWSSEGLRDGRHISQRLHHGLDVREKGVPKVPRAQTDGRTYLPLADGARARREWCLAAPFPTSERVEIEEGAPPVIPWLVPEDVVAARSFRPSLSFIVDLSVERSKMECN